MATKRKEHPKKNQNDNKTHCVHGHEFTVENTYYHKGNRHCRVCMTRHHTKYVGENKSTLREKQKRIREDMRSRGLIFPSQTPESKKRDSLKELGWTPEMFNSTLDVQGSKCAICEKSVNLDKVQNESRACADHVHSVPPVPRAVLCMTCNAGLGHFKDNPSFLRQAAAYLECVTNNDDVSAFVRGKRDIWQQV